MNANRKKFKVLGVFEGECADSTITNLNGLDITRPVWEMTFASEEYKQGIDCGWFIGFLGHPVEPDCQDFEKGCIVMTEGHIEPNGKVYCKFNLIDTPVGRIVKTFIDAGVKFGISVRGAGDIYDNSVDPETFVFRGFDLVAFPAFPESIPTFTEIAASTNIDDRKKYAKICSAIESELDNISDSRTLSEMQRFFAAQSDTYKQIDAKINSTNTSIVAQKLEAMTNLYIEACDNVHKLALENERLKIEAAHEASRVRRKIAAVERITASQLSDADRDINDMDQEVRAAIRANKELQRTIRDLNRQISDLSSSNLKYEQDIRSSETKLKRYESIMSGRERELDETVNELERTKSRSSNFDEKMEDMRNKLQASEAMCEEYRTAYAQLYSQASGIDVNDIPITAGMSLRSLKQNIQSASRVMPQQGGMNDLSNGPKEIHSSAYLDDLITI